MFYVEKVYTMVDVVDTQDGVSEGVSFDFARKFGNISGVSCDGIRSLPLEDVVAIQLLIYKTVNQPIPFKIKGTTLVKCLQDVERVVVPYGITEISSYAFRECTALKEIVLPMSLITIEMGAFYRCSSLQKIKIPDSVQTLGTSVFMWCSALRYAKLSSKLVTLTNGTFLGCSSLERVDLPDTLEVIGTSAFGDCYKLAEIQFPKALETIQSEAFSYCTSLQEVVLRNKVRRIGEMAFKYCKSLQRLVIDALVETRVEVGAFSCCKCLDEVYLGKVVLEGKEKNDVFLGCAFMQQEV